MSYGLLHGPYGGAAPAPGESPAASPPSQGGPSPQQKQAVKERTARFLLAYVQQAEAAQAQTAKTKAMVEAFVETLPPWALESIKSKPDVSKALALAYQVNNLAKECVQGANFLKSLG